MNKDHSKIICINDKIEELVKEIKYLSDKVKKADGHMDSVKNLIRKR